MLVTTDAVGRDELDRRVCSTFSSRPTCGSRPRPRGAPSAPWCAGTASRGSAPREPAHLDAGAPRRRARGRSRRPRAASRRVAGCARAARLVELREVAVLLASAPRRGGSARRARSATCSSGDMPSSSACEMRWNECLWCFVVVDVVADVVQQRRVGEDRAGRPARSRAARPARRTAAARGVCTCSACGCS